MRSIIRYLTESRNINASRFFSKDTISVDLHKFEDHSSNKLLIIGHSGGGKTTLGKKLTREYKIPIYHCDNLWTLAYNDMGIPEESDETLTGTRYNIAKQFFDNHLNKKLLSTKKEILDGIYFVDNNIKNNALRFPCIILGVSQSLSFFRSFKRDWDFMGNNLPHKLWNALYYFIKDQLTGTYTSKLKKFKNERINQPDAIVKPFII
jgi:adenylate kinase family enzyme